VRNLYFKKVEHDSYFVIPGLSGIFPKKDAGYPNIGYRQAGMTEEKERYAA
jgi:hypothetical protein